MGLRVAEPCQYARLQCPLGHLMEQSLNFTKPDSQFLLS